MQEHALTHPELEELAAFLDGKLPEKDRARAVEHLADCEECYEIFAGAARFQEDSKVDEPEGDSVVPFPSPIRRWLPLAAAALLAVAVGVPVYRAFMAPPDMAVGEIAAPYRDNADAASAELWLGTQYRGGAGPDSEQVRDHFQLGLQVTNLHLGLVTGKQEISSGSVIPQIQELLGGGSFFGMTPYQARYRELRGKIDEGRPIQELLEVSAELDRDLDRELEEDPFSPYVDLGKWTAAARLAAVTKNPDFFDRRDNRRFPSWFLREERDSIEEPEVVTALQEIQTILGQDEIDYGTLRTNLETILTTYDD